MTTVSELIEWLKTQDQDAEVNVVVGVYHMHDYMSKEAPLNLDPYNGNVDVCDGTVTLGDPL